MATAKVFQSGNSQAVRIPREFQFDVAEVEIQRQGDALLLRPRSKDLSAAFSALAELPADYCVDGRDDPVPQSREAW